MLRFCQAGSFSPIPVSQSLLCMYVSYLAEQKLKHGSIKVNLSAVHNWQIASCHPVGAAMPQLDQVMKGIKWVQAERGGVVSRARPFVGGGRVW